MNDDLPVQSFQVQARTQMFHLRYQIPISARMPLVCAFSNWIPRVQKQRAAARRIQLIFSFDVKNVSIEIRPNVKVNVLNPSLGEIGVRSRVV